MNIQTKIKKSKKFFFHASFETMNEEEILSDLPADYYSELALCKEKLNKRNINLRPCYERPLLTKDQEIHLFRKMNFFKYLISKKIENKDLNNLSIQEIDFINKYFSLYENTRNELVLSNTRLVTFLIKSNLPHLAKEKSKNIIISNCYYDLFKIVDSFNWTIGNRFSTYAVAALRKNSWLADRKAKEYLEIEDYEDVKSEILNLRYKDDINHNIELIDKKSIVNKALLSLEKVNKRQYKFLKSYFGIEEAEKNLSQIGIENGLTRERVRQIRNDALLKVKNIISINMGGVNSKKYECFVEDFFSQDSEEIENNVNS